MKRVLLSILIITSISYGSLAQALKGTSLEVNGNILQYADNTAFGIDAQPNARLGFIKKFSYFPSIASDINSPIIFVQTNQNGIFTNISGATLTERMRIHINGNVGIATSSPTGLFHLRAKGAGWDDHMILESSSGGMWQFLVDGGSANRLRIRNRDSGIEAFTFQTNGNVGIGIPTPSEKMEVNGSIKIARDGRLEMNRGRLGFSSAAADWNHVIYNNNDNIDNEGVWDGMKFNVYDGAWFRVGPYNNYKTAFYANANGQVGIGTTSPSGLLSLKASSDNRILDGYSNSNKLMFQMNTVNAFPYLSLYDIDGTTAKVSINTNGVTYFNGGKVGINTSSPDLNYELSVNGKIKTKEIKVTQLNWSDYVFYNNYKLRPLTEVESFIKENQHLPEVPSAAEVEKDGINVGEMNALLLKKIEELTLYMIEMKKENEALKGRIQKLETR